MNNMTSQLITLLVLSAYCGLGTQPVQGQNKPFRFLATGDTPYSAAEEATLRRLLKKSESEDFAFLMHVGDIKGGNEKCTDKSFKKIRDLFRNYPKPVVYTPGANEWTD